MKTMRGRTAVVTGAASVAGLMSNPDLGPCNAAKYGVIAIMETLYLEMERDPDAAFATD